MEKPMRSRLATVSVTVQHSKGFGVGLGYL
jgi:hypothetical protein